LRHHSTCRRTFPVRARHRLTNSDASMTHRHRMTRDATLTRT
jgi:hypothetical protein